MRIQAVCKASSFEGDLKGIIIVVLATHEQPPFISRHYIYRYIYLHIYTYIYVYTYIYMYMNRVHI